MALDAVGLQQPLRYDVDIKSGLVRTPMTSQLMKGDRHANRVIVAIKDGKENVDLSGVAVTGSFIRPPDDAEIPLVGSVDGNEAIIVLEDVCYAQDGYCEISVTLTVGSTSRTILTLTGHVLSKGSGAVIDVGGVIPNINDIIAQYAEMKDVTERTLAAAQRAEALAIDASGYAANTGKLGGQPPSYYAKKDDVTQLSQQVVLKSARVMTRTEILPSATYAVGSILPFTESPSNFDYIFGRVDYGFTSGIVGGSPLRYLLVGENGTNRTSATIEKTDDGWQVKEIKRIVFGLTQHTVSDLQNVQIGALYGVRIAT